MCLPCAIYGDMPRSDGALHLLGEPSGEGAAAWQGRQECNDRRAHGAIWPCRCSSPVPNDLEAEFARRERIRIQVVLEFAGS